jgi:hypothetical protein
MDDFLAAKPEQTRSARLGAFGVARARKRAQAPGMPEPQDLPYVDQHSLAITAPRANVWAALERYAGETIVAPKGEVLARLIGAEPISGFAVAERDAERRLALEGRHRFSRYRLVFELLDAPDGATELRASTYALFPGLHGRIYRALVIGTRLHVLATRGLLRAVRRRSLPTQ